MPESINALVHLGAGRCSELQDHLALQPQRMLLVEADPQLSGDLINRCSELPQVKVAQAAVTGQPGAATFYRYNLPDTSSLHLATGLLELYPGLKVRSKLSVTSVVPKSLVEPLRLQPDDENLLIIDVPGEELPVMQSLHDAGQLHLFSHVQLRCGRQPLYEGGVAAKRILHWLQEQGYELLVENDTDDPDRPCWILQRNALQLRYRELQEQLAHLSDAKDEQFQLNSEQQKRIEQLTKARDEQAKMLADREQHIEQLSQARDEQAKLASDFQQQLKTLTNVRDEQERLASENQEKLESLTKELDTERKIASERQALLDKYVDGDSARGSQMLDLLAQQKDHLDRMEQGIIERLTKKMQNTTRQIESFVSVEAYLDRGERLPSLHGWPVSADMAVYLIDLIEKNNYDLILEFGSGASTVLMANVLQKQEERRHSHSVETSGEIVRDNQLTYENESANVPRPDEKLLRERASATSMDLPPRIITFEHQREYFDDTKDKLARSGVDDFVELVYAPLRDYVTHDGEHYLYYACDETLSRVGAILGSHRARILLLVDGPPGSTCNHARYPALPIVLQYFTCHKFDVLLDDYNRKEEKEVVDKWGEFLSKRSVAYEARPLDFEKGACILRIE